VLNFDFDYFDLMFTCNYFVFRLNEIWFMSAQATKYFGAKTANRTYFKPKASH